MAENYERKSELAFYDRANQLADELSFHVAHGELAKAIEKIVRARGALIREEASLRETLDEESEEFEQQKKEIDDFFEILNQDWEQYMKDVRETDGQIEGLKESIELLGNKLKDWKPPESSDA